MLNDLEIAVELRDERRLRVLHSARVSSVYRRPSKMRRLRTFFGTILACGRQPPLDSARRQSRRSSLRREIGTRWRWYIGTSF